MRLRVRNLAPMTPYVAVLIGMYGLKSAFVAIGLYHLGMIAVLLHRKSTPSLEYSPASPALYLTSVIYASSGLIFYLVWPLLSPDSGCIADSLKDFGLTRDNFPYFAVYFCLVNSTIEELFWRGYLGSDSKRLTPNDFYFAGYHALVLLAFASIFWAIPVIAAVSFAGWLWRQLRRLSGGLVLPVITHIVADISIIVAVYFRLFV